MKLEGEKHNHKLTHLLKVLLFAVLMAVPLLSVATRCLYVICNKNAYQSAEITQTTYSRTPKYTQGDINNSLEVDKIYHLEMDEVLLPDFFDTAQNSLNFNIVNGGFSYLVNNGYTLDDFMIENDTSYYDYTFSYYDNESQLYVSVNNNNIWYYIIVEIDEISFNGDILITGYDDIYAFDLSYFSNTTYQDYDYIEVESTTLDNVFEYSIAKLENEEYITWTKSTAVYTGVNAMTTSLGMEGAVIPMLITYWFFLTIIYVIIDIVLKSFEILTHMITKKV